MDANADTRLTRQVQLRTEVESLGSRLHIPSLRDDDRLKVFMSMTSIWDAIEAIGEETRAT